MNMTQAQMDRVKRKLAQLTVGTRACPACGTKRWELQAGLMEIRSYNEGVFLAGAPLLPGAVVACQTCGFTQFFNLITLGFISRETGQWING